MCLDLPMSGCVHSIHFISFAPPTAGIDFSTAGVPQQVTIPPGQTSVQFTVTVIDELIVERDELFHLSFTYSGGQAGVKVRSGFDQTNITIRNDDGTYIISSFLYSLPKIPIAVGDYASAKIV